MKRTAIKRKTPLRRVSSKRSKAMRIYAMSRKDFLSEFPLCEKCGGKATEIHHKAGRSGPNYLDIRTWIPLCGPCHRAVHARPSIARAKGLLK